MYKKRDRKAQVTLFIIVGLAILFSAVLIISLTYSFNKNALSDEQQKLYSQLLQSEGLNIYLEDCLEDPLQDALYLISRQGRLWSGQPGGIITFKEGVSGTRLPGESEEEGSRIFYGITREETSSDKENFYPCDYDQGSLFCTYAYPNITIGFGQRSALLSLVQGDLQRYLKIKTVECVNKYVDEKISEDADLQEQDFDLQLELKDTAIQIKAVYPLRVNVQGKDFFAQPEINLIYQTDFKKFLSYVVDPALRWDISYVDFPLDSDTLNQDYFTYKRMEAGSSCKKEPNSDLYSCQFPLTSLQGLGISLESRKLSNGDDLLTFTSSQGDFVYRTVRQNRPPALDYISRNSCPEKYDYLVILQDKKIGSIDLELSAHDPDEDKITYKFDKVPEDWKKGLSQNRLKIIPEKSGFYTFTASASDSFLSDWQDVRIAVDKPALSKISFDWPYSDPALGNNAISDKEDGKFIISREDPSFLKISPENNFLVAEKVSPSVSYEVDGKPIFSQQISISSTDNQGNQGFCYAFSGSQEKDCASSSYYSDPSKLIASIKNPLAGDTAAEGKLKLSTTVGYCGNLEQKSDDELAVGIKECVPFRNNEHPFAYPYHLITYGLYPNGSTNTNDQKQNTEINPFLSTHRCCNDDWTVKKKGEPCFINPLPGCYGRISGVTTGNNKGYILEEESALCDGIRGNICDLSGGRIGRLYQDKMACGYNDKQDCKNIDTNCVGKDSFSMSPEKGWCSGTMGCSSFCTSEVIKLGDKSSPSKTALELKSGDLSQWFSCGCAPININKPCDKNFDGEFKGTCQKVEGNTRCVGDS
jgi:hypothetical protein